MSDFQKELLTEIIREWDEQKLFNYIYQLELRQAELNGWLQEVKSHYRKLKKSKKQPLEMGTRDGR